MRPVPGAVRVILRRRVALAGHVVRGADRATGGTVRLESDTRAAVEAPIRADGSYFFLDLPPGDWVARGHDERGTPIEAKAASIVPVAVTERSPLLDVDLPVQAIEAAATGRIT